MKRSSLLLCALLIASLAVPASARSRRHRSDADATPRSFDYYILALSWAPNFCATHAGNANECGSGRHVGFVVHGLWPQGENGRLDQSCTHASPLARDVVQYALNFYPSAGLVQHEWECHGQYSGLTAQQYFTAVGRAFQSLKIPNDVKSMSRDVQESGASLTQSFAQANNASPESFIATCHDQELVAVEACYTKDLKLRRCGGGVHTCAGPLLMRAPR